MRARDDRSAPYKNYYTAILFDVHMIWKFDIFGKIRFRRK